VRVSLQDAAGGTPSVASSVAESQGLSNPDETDTVQAGSGELEHLEEDGDEPVSSPTNLRRTRGPE
jgi:hypothetical protein